jgi:hypothetical protein
MSDKIALKTAHSDVEVGGHKITCDQTSPCILDETHINMLARLGVRLY